MSQHDAPPLCNLDGTITAESEARIPVLDRGFLFGDSIYEVIRTRGGKLFAWRQHLDRLRSSAAAIGLQLDLSDREIMARLLATLDQAGFPESYVRIIVSRGTGTAPNIDVNSVAGPPLWVILVRPLPPAPKTAEVCIVDRLRNDRRALDPATKSGNYLNNVLGLAEARQRGATDCVFLNQAGKVTEASTSNVFAVCDGRAVTPPLEAGILAGTTRRLLLERLRAEGMPVEERDIDRHDLESAEEIWLCSTLRDVSPVTHLDGRPLRSTAMGEAVGAAFSSWADQRAVADDRAARELAAG
jgi:branched-chain amino acid aminotransferase